MHLVVLELTQEVVDFLCLGNEIGRTYERLPTECGWFAEMRQQVLDIEYAFDVIATAHIDRYAGIGIINNALQGKKLPVYGDGKNVRDWLYVEDHAKAIDMVQEQGRLFETYNIGGHNEKQNIEIIHIILDTLQEMLPDCDPRKAYVNEDLITYVEDRKGHDRRYAIAPDKIKAQIGWYPETMFKEGIRKTIRWFFENEDWMKNVTSGDYQKYYTEMYEK